LILLKIAGAGKARAPLYLKEKFTLPSPDHQI
jgi:hypothetical protein